MRILVSGLSECQVNCILAEGEEEKKEKGCNHCRKYTNNPSGR